MLSCLSVCRSVCLSVCHIPSLSTFILIWFRASLAINDVTVTYDLLTSCHARTEAAYFITVSSCPKTCQHFIGLPELGDKKQRHSNKISIKPRPHQQQCRSNIVECYQLNDSFDKVECCFDKVERRLDFVAVFGNNVISCNFVLSTNSKQIEHVQFLSTLSKTRNFTKNSFDIVAVLATKSYVASTKSNVASTLLLVWKGF